MKVMKCHLEWLGHVAKMPENRTPKICLFSWLPQPRPRGGPRLRWRDVVWRDLRAMNVSEERWYDEATVSRARWRNTCREGLNNLTTVIGDQETANQIKSAVDPLEERVTRSDTNASQNDRNLSVSSVVQHSVTGGLGVVAGYLSTTADLTKQVIPSFALPPYGGRMAVKWQLN